MSERLTRWLSRLSAIVQEMDYGGRRALELRTGYVYTPETRRRLARAQIERLEELLDRDR